MLLPLGSEYRVANLVGTHRNVIDQKLVLGLILGDDVNGLLNAVESPSHVRNLKFKEVTICSALSSSLCPLFIIISALNNWALT